MLLAVLLAGLALVGSGAAGASAPSVQDSLEQARAKRQQAVLALQELQATLADLRSARARVEASLDQAAADLLAAYQAELEATTRLARAEDQLAVRARAAFRLGPAASLALLFSAETPADLAAAQEFASSAMEADVDAIQAVESARADLERRRAAVQERKRELAERERELSALLAEADRRVQEAGEAARAAGMVVEELEAELAAIEAARARQEARAGVHLDPSGGVDESKLLALLGPTGGRTCTIPDGLRDTGADLSGLSSWYGWDFAGQTTASGAIYDPRLFTAAHRELPFGTFLRVRYDGRCAIVLVNDRGPYGNEERILDLSMASAKYLGVGVSRVRADILVPR